MNTYRTIYSINLQSAHNKPPAARQDTNSLNATKASVHSPTQKPVAIQKKLNSKKLSNTYIDHYLS